jgi:hypothetical protein
MADKAAPPLIAADLLKRLIPGPMPDASGGTGGPVPTVQEGLHRMHWSRPVNQRPSYASGQANPEGAGSGASNRRLTTQLIAALQIAPPHPLDALTFTRAGHASLALLTSPQIRESIVRHARGLQLA